jgi:hypothetical protein
MSGYVGLAGFVILGAFVASVVLLANSAFDTGQRGFGHGALTAASWLEVSWVAAAAPLVVGRWRGTTKALRAVFMLNTAIVLLLARDFFWPP